MGVKKKVLTALAVVLCLGAFSQEDLLWYFGEGKAGLKFDSGGGAPVVANDPAFVIYESISVVSDCEGSLRFYTDGTKIYDASHNLMTNGGGLLGPQESNLNPQSGSSANGVLVVGDPNDSAKYIVFTVGETVSGGVNLWRYHTVDMSLPGNGTAANPLGEVVSKNTVIMNLPVAEGMSAVANSCGDSLWVVTHGYDTDTLYALPVTFGAGIGSLVKTKIGVTLGGGNGARGSSDFSPNGDKYAMGYLWPGGGHIFDFDFATGVFSNSIAIPGTGSGVYGVEFSFDGASVYLGRWSLGTIEHYNVATNVVTNVATPGVIIGDIERAPDGKLYVATENTTWLGVINSPDVVSGGLANYNINGIDMGVTIDVGLPQMLVKPGENLISAQITAPFDLTDVCDKGGQLQLTSEPSCGTWSGGSYVDANGVFDPSGLATPGTYDIYYSKGECITPDTLSFNVEDCCPPLAVLGDQLCEGEDAFNVSTLVDTGIGIWSLTSTPAGNGSSATLIDSVFDASNYTKGSAYVTDGEYLLTYTYWNAPLVGCPDSAVAVVEVDSFPRDLFLGLNPATIKECAVSYEIEAKSGLEYVWDAPLVGATNTQTVSSNGVYVLTVNSPGETCFSKDSIEIELDQEPTAQIAQSDTVVCGSGSIVIGVDQAGLSYSWTPGSATTQELTVTTPDKYFVTILSGPNGFCPITDSVDVQLAPPLDINFIGMADDTTACPKLDTVIVAILNNPNNVLYTWTMGTSVSDSSVAIYSFNEGDVVGLVVEDAFGCVGSDDLTLHVYCEVKDPSIPNIFSPNTDGTNDTFTPIDFPPTEEGTYNALFPTSNMKIFDRWGLLMYEDNDYPEWDGSNKMGLDCADGVYFWVLDVTDINGKNSKKNGYVHIYR